MRLIRLARFLPFRFRNQVKHWFPRIASTLERTSLAPSDFQVFQSVLNIRLDLERHLNSNPLWVGPDGDISMISYSPFPPSPNGIGVYASHLVDALRQSIRVGVRVSGDVAQNSMIAGLYSAGLGFVADGDRPVCELYHLGNGAVHLPTWEHLSRRPGLVLLHDVRIPDIPLLPTEDRFFRGMSYAEKAATYAGRIPENVPAILVHSEHAKAVLQEQFAKAQKTCPRVHVLSTGHPVKASLPPRLMPRDRPLLGIFGFQYRSKDPVTAYKAMAMAAKSLHARAVVVGPISDLTERKLRAIWKRVGNRAEDLEVTGEVPLETFEQWINRVDLGIQLRTHSNGESSGPISQLMAAGVPTLATGIGAVSEYPDGALVKLRVRASPSEVASEAIRVLGNPVVYESLSRASTDHFRERTFGDAALEILDLARGALGPLP